MARPLKRFVLTPAEAAEKEYLVSQLRVNPAGPWVKGKKVSLPKPKPVSSRLKKKS